MKTTDQIRSTVYLIDPGTTRAFVELAKEAFYV